MIETKYKTALFFLFLDAILVALAWYLDFPTLTSKIFVWFCVVNTTIAVIYNATRSDEDT